MPELDHVFVCCEEGAPEASALLRLGLTEGSPNTHPGQGTASRRFFFRNAYVELLWVSDAREAQGEAVRPTRLWERWAARRTSACPFAVSLRPAAASSECEPPFPTWSYRPQYLPPDLAIEVAAGMPLTEPALFYIPFARRPDELRREPTGHAAGVAEITGVEIALPSVEGRSAAARSVETAGVVSFSSGTEYLMTLTLDRGARGSVADLRPELPLVVRW